MINKFTKIIIFALLFCFLLGCAPEEEPVFDASIINSYRKANDMGHVFIIPAVVYYEIRRGLLAVNATKQMHGFERLCEIFYIEEMTIEAWEKAAQIWAALKTSGNTLGRDDGDVFIAAQCIVNGYTLVTDNANDFERIDGLKYINWRIPQ